MKLVGRLVQKKLSGVVGQWLNVEVRLPGGGTVVTARAGGDGFAVVAKGRRPLFLRRPDFQSQFVGGSFSEKFREARVEGFEEAAGIFPVNVLQYQSIVLRFEFLRREQEQECEEGLHFLSSPSGQGFPRDAARSGSPGP